MIARNVLLRVMFCISLLLFIFATFSPWAGVPRPHRSIPLSGDPIWRDELYWSFQVVFYPEGLNGEEFRLFSWDFWFGPHDRLLLWDYWFSGDMQYHGLTFGWIHLFVLQLLTVFSGIYVLVWRWQEIKYLLVPIFFSFLSGLAGLELVSTFMFVWKGSANPYWGLHSANLSTSCFLGTFLIRYLLRARIKRESVELPAPPPAAPTKRLDLKILSKYFIHGFAFSVLLLVMFLVWVFVIAILGVSGAIIGLLIDFGLLILIAEYLDTIITDFLCAPARKSKIATLVAIMAIIGISIYGISTSHTWSLLVLLFFQLIVLLFLGISVFVTLGVSWEHPKWYVKLYTVICFLWIVFYFFHRTEINPCLRWAHPLWAHPLATFLFCYIAPNTLPLMPLWYLWYNGHIEKERVKTTL